MSGDAPRLLRGPQIWLVALLGLSALDVVGRLGAPGGTTVTAYQAGLVAVAALFAWSAWRGHEAIRPTPADLWLVVLVLAAAAAVPWALGVRTAVVQLASLCSSVALALLVAWTATTPGRLRAILVGLVGIGAVLAVLALLESTGVFSVQAPVAEFSGTAFRARVTFKDPNMLGGVLAAATAAGLSLAAAAGRSRTAAVLWLATLLTAAGAVTTQSRGAMAGLAIGLVLAIALTPMGRRARIAIGAGCAAALALAAVALGGEWVAARIVNVTGDQSVLDRLRLARAGLRMFADHPLGVGPGNFPLRLDAYPDAGLSAGLVESHITPVTVLAEDGLFGLAGLVGAVAASVTGSLRAARASDREVRAAGAATIGALSVLLVQSLTYSMETDKFLMFLVGAGLAAASQAGMRPLRRRAGRRKVCIVQYNSSRFLTRVDRAARALAGAGLDVVLVAIKDDDTPALETRDGYVVKRVVLASRRLPRWTRPLRFVEAVVRTFGAALREHADVYDARDIYPLLVTWAAARLRRARFVYDSDELNLHRNWPWTGRRWWLVLAGAYEGWFIRRADANITSDGGRADILASRYRIPRPVVVRNVPEAVDGIEPDLAFRERAVKGKRSLLLYAGGLVPNRGLAELVQAMELLPEFALAIVGPGQLAGELSDSIAGRGLADRAEVFPPMPYAELMRATASADAAVIPIVGSCLSYVHAAPNKLFESMMAGVPVVASDLPEMAAVVRAERAGTLIADPTDPASIAAAVRELFDGAEDPRVVGARAREAALARHQWKAEEPALLDVYRGIGVLDPIAAPAAAATPGDTTAGAPAPGGAP